MSIESVSGPFEGSQQVGIFGVVIFELPVCNARVKDFETISLRDNERYANDLLAAHV